MENKMQPPASVASRKRQNLTLDLDTASQSRRSKVQHLLTSPDVQMLKLTSPELEKFLVQNPSLATPTPSGIYNFPKSVTEEQYIYAKGFEDALEQVKQADSSQSEAATTLAGLSAAVVNHFSNQDQGQTGGGGGGGSVTNLASIPSLVPVDSKPPKMPSPNHESDSVTVKEEPDDSFLNPDGGPVSPVPSSSGGYSDGGMYDSNMSPIDMENQEKVKLERKRMRNRMAASKCRKRKLERIAQLDERVKQLKAENADLAAVVKKMKTSVASLKQEVIEHANSGCEIRWAESSFANTS